MLAGKWTYRSYRNDSRLVGDDAAAALGLIFGEGVFDFEADGDRRFHGALGMSKGYALTLAGQIEEGSQAEPFRFAMIGLGVDGSATEGWRYDYRGVIGYGWPNGVGQIPSLLGTVVRVLAHGPNSPAGVTASFIAVRKVADPRRQGARRPVLMTGV